MTAIAPAVAAAAVMITVAVVVVVVVVAVRDVYSMRNIRFALKCCSYLSHALLWHSYVHAHSTAQHSTSQRSQRVTYSVCGGGGGGGDQCVVLGVGIGMVRGLGRSVESSAADALESQTRSDLLASAQEVGSAVERRLQLVSNSATQVMTSQLSVLLDSTSFDASGKLPYNYSSVPSFYEFNFVNGCVPPDCPADYGQLMTRSRITSGLFGSVESSSVYVFDSDSGCALQTDSAVQAKLSSYPNVLPRAIDNSKFLDLQWRELYSKINSTVMFYGYDRRATVVVVVVAHLIHLIVG